MPRLDSERIGWMTVPQTSDLATAAPSSFRSTLVAFLGLVLVLVGVGGYFVVVLRFGGLFPNVRNQPIGPWLAVVTGVVLSAIAVRRARRRLVPAGLLAASVLLTGFFASFLYVMLRVPGTPGPPLGSKAADFALADQTGQIRRLADYAGKPLLLVFYRGHW